MWNQTQKVVIILTLSLISVLIWGHSKKVYGAGSEVLSQTLKMNDGQRRVTISDKGKQICLGPEEAFEIVLPNPLVGGFELDRIDYDESIMVLIAKGFCNSINNGMPDGSFVQIYFRFKTLMVGESNIDIWIKRDREVERRFFWIQIIVVS